MTSEVGLSGQLHSSISACCPSHSATSAAQFCDVYLFHFWKRSTKGKHLWLRNNGSTMVSQLVDATAVIFITFWSQFTAGEKTLGVLLTLIGGNYLFKVVVAAVDTIPFYIGVHFLKGYLRIDPTRQHDVNTEESVPSRAATRSIAATHPRSAGAGRFRPSRDGRIARPSSPSGSGSPAFAPRLREQGPWS